MIKPRLAAKSPNAKNCWVRLTQYLVGTIYGQITKNAMKSAAVIGFHLRLRIAVISKPPFGRVVDYEEFLF